MLQIDSQSRRPKYRSQHNIHPLRKLFSEGTAVVSPMNLKTSNFLSGDESQTALASVSSQKTLAPKNITMDKEELYDQVIKLKKQVHSLKKENHQLRIQILSQEREFRKLSLPSINDLSDQNHHLQSQTYKRHIKELNEELRNQQNNFIQLRKSIQYQNHKQQEDLINMQKEQIIDLKRQLDQQNFLMEAMSKVSQADAVKVLTEDNIRMASILQSKEEHIAQLTARNKELDSRFTITLSKNHGLKRVIQEKDKEIERLRQRDPLKDMNLQINALNDMKLRQELEKSQAEVSELQTDLNNSQKRVTDLDRKIKDVQNDLSQKYNQIEKEKQFFKEKCDKYAKEMLEATDKIKSYERAANANKSKRNTFTNLPSSEDSPQIKTFKSIAQFDDIEEGASDDDEDAETHHIKVHRVEKHQVEDYIFHLKYKFRNLKYSFADIEKVPIPIIKEQSLSSQKTQAISIRDMEITLQRYPFNIDDAKKRLLLARYLIEDNQKSHFYYDENQTANIFVVKSIFKTLLSNFQPFTKEEILELRDDVTSVFKQFKHTITDAITKRKSHGHQQDNWCIEDFINLLKSCEVPFSAKHFDFVCQTVYDKLNRLDNFKAEEFFKFFEESAYNFV